MINILGQPLTEEQYSKLTEFAWANTKRWDAMTDEQKIEKIKEIKQ